MNENVLNYCDYFNVDEKYFPCIDESAINSRDSLWKNTYPHETFIRLLELTENVLSGKLRKSIWIHGAYGTGKSQCAYTLKKLLDEPDDAVRAYWQKYPPLENKQILLEKLIAYKNEGIVTAFRYASGSITTPQLLFFAIQESIRKAIDACHVKYRGENTLKECIVEWLRKPLNAQYMNGLLEIPKWKSTFSQSSAEEIIHFLETRTDVSTLVNNILRVSQEEGITALCLSSDSLRKWISDIIDQNHIKLVLIWDEFSDFFRSNSTSLSEFQKIVSICQEKPFYFIIVTHPLSSLAQVYGNSDKSNPWSVVQQRFEKVEISLPDNIAFELIGQAFEIKDVSKEKWREMTNDLNNLVPSSRSRVKKSARISRDDVIPRILPIHPMAAFALKNIAVAYQSNQRSMFDFIKAPENMDVKAFQWFIKNTSPESDRPLLTVDMLWDFFYERGKEYLTGDTRRILDSFQQQTGLNENERIVLKTILILQALDERLGGSVDLLKPTDQNISDVFEGDLGDLATSCKSIAKALVRKNVLIERPLSDGKKSYGVAVLAGDNMKIESIREKISKECDTDKLVLSCPDIATALMLSPALKSRYEVKAEPGCGKLQVVTLSSYNREMEKLKNGDSNWRFKAVLALAKTDEEAMRLRRLIQETIVRTEYNNIIVIDALSTPLGREAFLNFVDYSSMAMYYQKSNNKQSKEYEIKARDVLEREWKNRIYNGRFIVFTHGNPEGERASNAEEVKAILQTIVLTRFPYVLDFSRGLTEVQFKLTQAKNCAEIGIAGEGEINGIVRGCERNVLGKEWGRNTYWMEESLANEPIVLIKKALDQFIRGAFEQNGNISIDKIYDFLESRYGFSESNLSAFLTGFLLKEYSVEPYRYMDSEGHRDSMSSEKLSQMIADYLKSKSSTKVAKSTYIVSLTQEEMAFYGLIEKAWNIPKNGCSSPQEAGVKIQQKMRGFGFPIWCLKEVDSAGVFNLVELFINFVQSSGSEQHDIATKIGRIAIRKPEVHQNLRDLLCSQQCQNGIQRFLERFENGQLLKLAKEIGAENSVLNDIRKCFDVHYSTLWIASTGEDEIRNLITDYEMVKLTNEILHVSAHSKIEAFDKWRETLNFVSFSCESLRDKRPNLSRFLSSLLKIVNREDMLPEQVKAFLEEMRNQIEDIRWVFDHSMALFMDIYKSYLDGFSEEQCESIKNSIRVSMFKLSSTESNATVKKIAEDFLKAQSLTQLKRVWSENAPGSKTPRIWSENHHTPILCCVPAEYYSESKIAFDILNRQNQSESEIALALQTIGNLVRIGFFKEIADSEYRDRCFIEQIIGNYANIVTDIESVRNALERTGISTYDWKGNPKVEKVVSEMASREYNAGGSDRVIGIIESMSDADLKRWLTDIVKKDIALGLRIITNQKG